MSLLLLEGAKINDKRRMLCHSNLGLYNERVCECSVPCSEDVEAVSRRPCTLVLVRK